MMYLYRSPGNNQMNYFHTFSSAYTVTGEILTSGKLWSGIELVEFDERDRELLVAMLNGDLSKGRTEQLLSGSRNNCGKCHHCKAHHANLCKAATAHWAPPYHP